MASDPDALLIFTMRGMGSGSGGSQIMAYHEELPEREEVPKPKPEKEEKAAMEPTSIYYKAEGDYPDPMQYYKEAVTKGGEEPEVRAAPKGRTSSKAMARELLCTAHPYRHAYAICSYCHRPFCFEDIIEYKKDYYCVEDIDRITEHNQERLRDEYSASILITSFVLIGCFVLFLYYSHGQMAYILGYVVGNPLGFFNSINLAYAISLTSLIVMLLSLVAALYILLGSKQSHIMASAISMGAVMLFTYQYVWTGTEYLAILAVLEFAAFLSAVHSAASGAVVYNKVYETSVEYRLAYGYGSHY